MRFCLMLLALTVTVFAHATTTYCKIMKPNPKDFKTVWASDNQNVYLYDSDGEIVDQASVSKIVKDEWQCVPVDPDYPGGDCNQTEYIDYMFDTAKIPAAVKKMRDSATALSGPNGPCRGGTIESTFQ